MTAPDGERFIAKRRSLLKAWRYVGPLLLVSIAGLAAYLYLNTPLMIDPFAVIAAVEAGAIGDSTLQLMAVFVPLLFLAVCFLLVVLVVLMYAAFANEKKYLAILDRLPRGRD